MMFNFDQFNEHMHKAKGSVRRTSWREGYELRVLFDTGVGLALCVNGKDWSQYCLSYEDRVADDWEIVT